MSGWDCSSNYRARLWRVGIPAAASLIAQALVNLTDVVIVSWLGAEELAGVSIGISVFTLVMLFGLGFVVASLPKLASAYAKLDVRSLDHVFTQSLVLALVVSLCCLLPLITTKEILVAVHYSQLTAEHADSYNSGASSGLVFFFLFVCVRNLATIAEQTYFVMFATFVVIPINAFISFFLAYGWGTFEGLGVYGAGLGSSVSRALVFLFVLHRMVRRAGIFQTPVNEISFFPDWELLKGFALTGLPISLRIVFAEGLLTFLNFFVGELGSQALALNAIIMRTVGIFSVFSIGISMACSAQIGVANATSDLTQIKRIYSWAVVSTFLFLLFAIFVALVLYGFAIYFSLFEMSFMSPNGALIMLGLILAYYIVSNGMMTISNGSLLGMSDTTIPSIVNVAGLWLVGGSAALFLAFVCDFELMGIWLGAALGETFVALVLGSRILRKTKIISSDSDHGAKDDR